MNPSDPRLPVALQAAISHVKATAQTVAEKVASHIGSQASSAARGSERDGLLAAQVDLRRNINGFHLAFAKALGEKVLEEIAPRQDPRRKLAAARWDTLTLVEDSEVEERMLSDRIAQPIAHACEWELREVASYMGGLLGLGRPDEERNPLRADVVGFATYRAIEAVTPDADARKLLAREFGQAMAAAMRECYANVVRELQQRRVQPAGLTVKTVAGPGQSANTGYATMRDELGSTRTGATDFHGSGGDAPAGFGGSTRSGAATRASGGYTVTGGYGGTNLRGLGDVAASRATSTSQAAADVEMMALLRRLTFLASRPGALDSAMATQPAGIAGARPEHMDLHGAISALATDPMGATVVAPDGLPGMMAVNLIRAHREELRQASSGKLDHMVIDVVGSLFDQILSDPKVPPQMARLIARLQLPVLRVALVDSSFFASRRHPVRRFVNRLASLACAFEDFADGPGKEFLDRVKKLVQEIVEGDFDQVELYADKLGELEDFIAAQNEHTAQASGTAKVLESKESELRVQQRYMLQLRNALAGIAMPDFLRDFVAQVWSQAIIQAIRRQGAEPELVKRFRMVGRDLVMSVQPKGAPAMRKRFLMQLPALMKDLNEGMKLIGWPEPAQKTFFGQLLPAHAESLRAAPMTELEHNLLFKQLEGIFNAAVPGTQDVPVSETVELESKVIEQRFTPAEAQQVGLVEEGAVDWTGPVDIDLSTDFAESSDAVAAQTGESGETVPFDLQGLGIDINLDVMTPDPAEPPLGLQLMDHIRVGFAYQMLLKDEWQKVRLSYVSPGRSFFVFTRGRRHQETISLTARMLARMCENNRLRAVEHAYLMERATARARRQLAALKVSAAH